MRAILLASLLLAAAAVPALAHTGAGPVSGFAAGFFHPLGGIDHLLAMLAVGVWAAQTGGRAVWMVPGAFVGTMAVGGIVGLAGIGIGGTETVIVASVLVLGVVIAAALKPALYLSVPLVGAFAFFHGIAHGAELPESAHPVHYALGFVLATALLHAVGIAAAFAVAKVAPRAALRIAGGAQVVAGVFLAAGAL
ncbi:MAG: HupE/UreJ family protein [Rhodospirillaceae bacterium]|nr:HupE/UreJ family protein [Rhodospirillaceae bacterium]